MLAVRPHLTSPQSRKRRQKALMTVPSHFASCGGPV